MEAPQRAHAEDLIWSRHLQMAARAEERRRLTEQARARAARAVEAAAAAVAASAAAAQAPPKRSAADVRSATFARRTMVSHIVLRAASQLLVPTRP